MRLPGDTDRIAIVGTTGSGKTHAALWHLSQRDFITKPWIIIDFKREDLINSIEGTMRLSLMSEAPEQPGIYIVQPNPGDEIELEGFFWKIWEKQNIGVFIDEGFMVGQNNDSYRAMLTQGRSMHIPMIVATQRPVWIDKFTFSEANFIQMFDLASVKDIQKVEEYIRNYDLSRPLKPRHSYYYERESRELVIMKPVPDREAILDIFDAKMLRLKKVV